MFTDLFSPSCLSNLSYNLQRTIVIMLTPAIPKPVKNLMTANIARECEKALAMPKKIVIK